MRIEGSVALVTGANRGLGREFARQLVERGAAKVYAGARDPRTVDLAGVEALRLDITDDASVAAAAALAVDVDLLVNNAGVSTSTELVSGDLAGIALELDTHLWGTLRMTRAFAPRLAGGAIVNVLSALSWQSFDGAGAYSVAKAAEWALTNGTRLELADQGTQVVGLHLSAADTDMMAGRGYSGPLLRPEDVIRDTLDAIEAGRIEVVADPMTAAVKAALATDPAEVYAAALAR